MTKRAKALLLVMFLLFSFNVLSQNTWIDGRELYSILDIIIVGIADMGSADSTELVNNATPNTNDTGEIALDTTITDHQPLWQYFDGGENMSIIAIDTSQLPALDNEIVKYDAGTDKFVLESEAGGGGSGDVTSVGNCTSGACFDGTSDGGTYIDYYDAQGRTRVIGGNTAAEVTLTLPITTGTLIYSGGAFHDGFSDYVANEHLDWTANVGTIDTGNYVENVDQNLFETITGITNDVVADTTTDSLTLTGAGILTIVGTTATDTITFTATEVDGSTSNEINTVQGDDNTATSGLAISIDGAGIVTTDVVGDVLTITGTEADTLSAVLGRANLADVDIQLGETDIKLDAVLSGDATWSGITIAGVSGVTTLAVGDLVYLNADDGRWELVDANLSDGYDKQLGICILAAADGVATEILVYGKVRSAVFPVFTVGSPLYISETGGDMTHTAPVTADSATRIIGFAISAEDMLFAPSQDYFTHTG